MKKIILSLWIIAFLILSNKGLGQSAGNVIYNNPAATRPERVSVDLSLASGNITELQASVMINVKATSFTAIFSATQNGVTARETDSLMDIRLGTALNALRQLGIHEKDLHIDVISLVPTYSLQLEEKKFSKTANEIPTGFQLKKNIHILFYDHDQLSEIVSQMAKAEIYDIVKVDYNIADLEKVYETLRKEASQIVANKASTYAEMGLHLEIQNLSDGFNAAYPIERYASYTAYYTGSSIREVKKAKKRKAAASKVYVMGKKSTVNIHTQNDSEDDTEFIINHTNKNKTIYYNRIPYNQFDLVLNADFVEPRIQFYYTLKARYTTMNLKNWEETKEKEILSKESKNKKGWFRKS